MREPSLSKHVTSGPNQEIHTWTPGLQVYEKHLGFKSQPSMYVPRIQQERTDAVIESHYIISFSRSFLMELLLFLMMFISSHYEWAM